MLDIPLSIIPVFLNFADLLAVLANDKLMSVI